jgi:hypothetical protein
MINQPVEPAVAAFLRDTLAVDALGVIELEARARAAGLLGERQRISHAKVFKRAKQALSIKSVRAGFGSRGGWLWELPRDRVASAPLSRDVSAASSIKRQPVRTERRVPLDWVEGVDRLDFQRPMTGVPRHRWRRFVDDCNSFMSSNWPERAAMLGWTTTALFGCHRNPLMYLGAAGLMWAMDGGELVDLHRDWAVIDRPVNRSQRTFYRRDVDALKVTLPWIEQDRRPTERR